jgi:hypothetical protein
MPYCGSFIFQKDPPIASDEQIEGADQAVVTGNQEVTTPVAAALVVIFISLEPARK